MPASDPADDRPGTLYLVPTPIGNVRDITLRGMDVLAAVALVAAEDTRKTRTLLGALGIRARLVSYHDFNERERAEELLGVLRGGEDVALVTDAGTPLVNDPGFRIVTAAIAHGVAVHPLPGASAALTALIGSGLPSPRFTYVGFLPRRSGARRAALGTLADTAATLIIFEAPHRLLETLADVRAVLGDRPAALARNLTKPDEAYLRGPLSAIEATLSAGGEVRGEYTLVVAGAAERETGTDEELADRITRALMRHGIGLPVVRDVVREVTGLRRNEVYDRVQAIQDAHTREGRVTGEGAPGGGARDDRSREARAAGRRID